MIIFVITMNLWGWLMWLDRANWLLNKQFINFILFGVLNTTVTYLLYLFLSKQIHYQLAYLIVYVAGIILAYVLNLFFVFNTRSSFKKIISYPFIYIVQYAIGAGLLYILLRIFSLSNALAPLLVTIFLLPVSYYMNRKILVN